MSRKAILFVIIFPVIALLAWLAQINFIKLNGQKIRMAIAGYDPRDLLAGHYLQYRINYGAEFACGYNYNPHSYCACLKQTDNKIYQADKFTNCDSAGYADCPLFIKGQCQYGQFSANIERYYFPEEYSEKLRTVPAESTVELSVGSNGLAIVTGLFVKDQPILEWAKSQ